MRPAHKVAWLIQAAIDGEIDLVEEGKREVRLVRKGQLSGPLATAFGGRDEIELGSYDATFASGWGQIDDQLQAWSLTSGLWDPLADRRKTGIRVLGALAMLAGAVLAFFGGFAASRWGEAWLVVVVVGSLLGRRRVRGAAARLGAPGAHAATAPGLWLRVESFRRFLHESETFHAEEAAKRGVLREYTAWAVALDEIDRWERAVAGSTTIPQDAGLGYVHMAPMLSQLHRVGVHRAVVERQRRGRRRLGRRRRRRRRRRQLVSARLGRRRRSAPPARPARRR